MGPTAEEDGWVGGLGAHSNQNPAQSIQHFMLPSGISLVANPKYLRTLFLHLHLSCPSRLVYRGPVSFFVPAYASDTRTGAGTFSRTRPSSHKHFISRIIPAGLYYAIISGINYPGR